MATRRDFSDKQWQALRDAPHLVGLAIAAAGNPRLFEQLAASMTHVARIAWSQRAERGLLHDLLAREVIHLAKREIKHDLMALPAPDALDAYLQQAALETTAAALAALANRGTDRDADDFRSMLRRIGEAVTNSMRDGRFIVEHDGRALHGERRFLARLDGVIGTAHA
jgi:hypothetical protein